MKTTTWILLIFLLAIISSCEGPVGPMGPPGQNGQNGQDGQDGQDGAPGEDGVNILGSVFDIIGDFTEENNYTLSTIFPDNIEVFESDIVLVYILWEQTEIDGEPADVWRLLPQTAVFDEGILQYNFDYTFADVLIFMEGTLDPNLYQPEDTDNQVFRIAVLPADLVTKKSVDISDIGSVLNSLQINPTTIQKSALIKK